MSFDKGHPNYESLRVSIRENPNDFIAVIGAGLSRPAGLPTWVELRNILIRDARNRISDYEELEKDGYVAALNRIEANADLWACFSELKTILTEPIYNNIIIDKLRLGGVSKVPETYELLWRLGIKGIVSFNIDTCAIDSYSRINGNVVDFALRHEFHKYSYFLSSPNKFVFYPHGIVTDPLSWVFTEAEKTRLLATRQYIDFMRNIFQGKHLLIIGFNPNDFAFKYLLQESIVNFQTTGSKHYILLPSLEISIIRDLSSKGIMAVTYKPSDPVLHTEIKEVLLDILEFRSTDDNSSTVYLGEKVQLSTLSTVPELLTLPIDVLRKKLNGAVISIIPPEKKPEEDDLVKLDKFYKDYLGAIHQAWLVEPGSPYDTIHGYRVKEAVGRGSFGQVYEAENIDTGHRAAVKILLPEVKNKRDYINSFRRGIRSMKILTSRAVKGMVKFEDAFEVPACVIMEFIDGPDLNKAKNSGILCSFSGCLQVLVDVGKIVKSAHDLEERVLHRDLKPSNIMLAGGWVKDERFEVIVLDFDLSWHKGALDVSVVHGARAQGYAAPEQTATGGKSGITTRHTAVDVFGYGMVAFFLFTGRDPRPNEQNFDNFTIDLENAIRKEFETTWVCLPKYLANLVSSCVEDVQSKRIGFSEAIEAFKVSLEMTTSNQVPSNHPLILLEIASRIDPDGKYDISDFGRKVNVKGIEGKNIELELSKVSGSIAVCLKIIKIRSGMDARFVTKYLPTMKEKIISLLKKFKFDNIDGVVGTGRIDVSAIWLVPDKVSVEDLSRFSNTVLDARAELDSN